MPHLYANSRARLSVSSVGGWRTVLFIAFQTGTEHNSGRLDGEKLPQRKCAALPVVRKSAGDPIRRKLLATRYKRKAIRISNYTGTYSHIRQNYNVLNHAGPTNYNELLRSLGRRYWPCSPLWSQLVRVTVELSPDEVDACGKPSIQAPSACSNFVVQLIAPWFQAFSPDDEQRRRRYRHASNAYKSCIDK